MQKPPIPFDDDARLAELAALEILYTEPEEAFDRVTAELARIFEAPVASMSLIDRDTQFYKSAAGTRDDINAVRILPRDYSICGHVVGSNEMLIIDDLSKDPRFADNPFIRQSGARFYAGAPLRTDTGRPIGSLCILDFKPRQITPHEKDLLKLVADGVMTAVKLRTASRRLAERSLAVERDLAQARNVQRFLLPAPQLAGKEFSVSHLYIPFDKVGGDFLDVILRPDDSAVLLLADVSGHGVTAALTSTMTKSIFRRCANTISQPQELLTAINRDLASLVDAGSFMTAAAAIYDPASRSLHCALAGHPAPLRLRDQSLEELDSYHDIPLLVEPDKTYDRNSTFQLCPGDRLLFYTDGAIEAANPDRQPFALEGLRNSVLSARDAHGPDFLARILQDIRTFTHHHLSDDIALITLECTPA